MIATELDAAIQQIKAGQTHTARRTLIDFLRREPRNEEAWLWLSSVVDTDDQRRDCLERVLVLNPDNDAARLHLDRLGRSGAYPAIEREFQRRKSAAFLDDVTETKLVTLSCPSCGAGLHITGDRDVFVCPACGNSHLVKRSAGMVALEPVLKQMREMQDEVERTSRELNAYRLMDEIAELEKARKPHQKGLADGIKIIITAVLILVFLNIGFFFQPLIFLGLFMLAGGLAWTSYHFIKQRELETKIQLKQMEMVRERNS